MIDVQLRECDDREPINKIAIGKQHARIHKTMSRVLLINVVL